MQDLDAIAQSLYRAHIGPYKLAPRDKIRDLLKAETSSHPLHFLLSEWEQIVDAWQLSSWEEYRDVSRLGRRTRLPEKQRAALWEIFDRVRSTLKTEGLITKAGLYAALTEALAARRHPVYEHIVVDEAQDVSIPQLRFLATLGKTEGVDRPNALFFAGDLGQRIFQQPFSWKSLGVDIRGRARTLRINYRTSHQIRQQADRLLGPEVTDVDGNTETRQAVSVFNGPSPEIRTFKSSDREIAAVAERLGMDRSIVSASRASNAFSWSVMTSGI